MKVITTLWSAQSDSATASVCRRGASLRGAGAGLLCGAILLCNPGGDTARSQIAPKPATSFTAATNAHVYQVLDFSDLQDFEDATRGFIAGLEPPRIILNDVPDLNSLGFYAWDMESYQFLSTTPAAPASANPSLWRQEQLNNINGLFAVVANSIYQVRSYDLATMSFVRTRTGWVVIDPLMTRETARAGLDLFRQHVSADPIVAIIVTHSHHDHYNGIPGILAAEGKIIADARGGQKKGSIPFYAPGGFFEEALSENLYLGNAMSRRADYMYGVYLARGERGQIGSGLGKTKGFGSGLLVQPTYEIKQNGSVKMDGLEVQFQLAPGTEAPSEMHVFFSQYGAFCPGENVSHTMHNLLTLRGAKVRDPKAWAQYIDEAIDLFGPRTQVLIGVHHWPVWGSQRCLAILEKQRDMYRFFNDQVIRMLNDGMNMEEIADAFDLPATLDREFYNRGYYGSKNHNAKAVVQHYLGWWDGNPANYFKYPEKMAAQKYVEFMGGESAVIAKARQSFEQGDYRWVAEVMKHVVFANPASAEARQLQADAFEQLGYTFESGPWRNVFLSGAEELRNGNFDPPPTAFNLAAIATMPPTLIFDYLSTRLLGKQAEALDLRMRFLFTDDGLADSERNLYVVLKNGVLHCKNNKPNEAAAVTYTLTRTDLLAMLVQPPDATFNQFRTQLVLRPNPVWNIVLPLDYDNRRAHTPQP